MSPSREMSPDERSVSLKAKRSILKGLVGGMKNRIELTIYDGWEYKWKVQELNPTNSRELVYKKALNMKDRKV